MKKLQLCVLFTGALFAFSTLRAQTAEELIAKHIEAIGGKDKVNGITSYRWETSMDIMGNSTTSVSTVLIGKGLRSETDFQGQKIIQIVTDKGGWAMNPMSGSNELQPMPEEQYKSSKDMLYVNPLVDYSSRGVKLELQGKEKAGENDAYKIKYTTADGVTSTFFIDATTYYIVKRVQTANVMGQEAEVTTSFSNFKKTDYGVVLPYTTSIDFGQFQMAQNLTKAEFNKPVDPAIFTPGK